MTHFIPRKAISQITALIASAAFVFIGVSAQANAQAQGSTADTTGLFAGQSYGIQTPQGTNVMWFKADGSCTGTAEPARGRRTNYTCRYEANQIDSNRVSLTVRKANDGFRKASTETLRMMPDGNLFNETARTTAFRLRPDGFPYNDTRGRR